MSKWRKSSKSNSGASCVEVRNDLAAIRDSKDPAGPALGTDVAGLLNLVKSGRLDR
jgi:hypothetical protein